MDRIEGEREGDPEIRVTRLRIIIIFIMKLLFNIYFYGRIMHGIDIKITLET